ncbi:MAG: hypothetical protein ACRDRI_22100 [Pseudonocardiaceae bacterium]
MADGATPRAKRENPRAIPVTCALHRGPRNFANLDAATVLFDVPGEWLR